MALTIPIDKAGRVVLPKAIRERMDLHEGSRLLVEVVGDKIELTPAADEVQIEERDGLRVVVGWDGFDAAQAVRDAREEALERLERSPEE